MTPCHLPAHPSDERCRVTPGQWLPQLHERHGQGARPAAEAERSRHSRVLPGHARIASPLYGHRRDPRRWRINTGTAAAVAPWGTWRRWCWITAPTTPRSATATRTSGEGTVQGGADIGRPLTASQPPPLSAGPAPLGRSPARGPATRLRSLRRGAAGPRPAPAAAAGPAPAVRAVLCSLSRLVTLRPSISHRTPLYHTAPHRPPGGGRASGAVPVVPRQAAAVAAQRSVQRRWGVVFGFPKGVSSLLELSEIKDFPHNWLQLTD